MSTVGAGSEILELRPDEVKLPPALSPSKPICRVERDAGAVSITGDGSKACGSLATFPGFADGFSSPFSEDGCVMRKLAKFSSPAKLAVCFLTDLFAVGDDEQSSVTTDGSVFKVLFQLVGGYRGLGVCEIGCAWAVLFKAALRA